MKLKLIILGFVLFSFSHFSGSVFAEDKNIPSGIIPKLPKTLNDPELLNGHVYPFWGPPCQRYTYSVIYRDKEGRKPEYVKIYFNGRMIDMDKESDSDNNYKKGVKYIYKNVPNKLDSNFYYFEASNGQGKARASIIDSPDNGPVLFTTPFDKNEISVINKNTGQKILNFSTGKEWIGGIALSDDGKYLAAKASKHIYLFDLFDELKVNPEQSRRVDTAKPKEPLWSFNCEQCRIGDDVKGGIDISGDGSRIIAGFGEMVALFDKSSNQPVWKYRAGNSYNVAISKDGKYMAAATAGEESDTNSDLIILWNGDSEKPLWQYHAPGNFHDVSLSDNGSFITGSTGCPDRRFYLFSRDSNKPLIKSDPLTRDSPVHRAKISADGTLMAVGSEADAGAVFLFSKDKGQVWKFPTSQGSSVRALNFTPDGQYIGAATFGGDAYIFDKNKNTPVAEWKVNASLGGIDIADDGSFIAAGGTDNKLYIFDRDAKSKTEIPFDEYIEEVDISANGKYIAAGTGGSVYFFETYVSQDRGKVFDCSNVIEPPSESQMMKDAGVNENGERVNPIAKTLPIRPPGMLTGFAFLGSLLVLAGYFATVKLNLLRRKPENLFKLNKKILAVVSAVTVLFLLLTLVFMILNKPPVPPAVDQKSEPESTINQEAQKDQPNLQKDTQNQQAVCGNNLCEPDLGESRQTCPKDCSAGD